MPKNIQHVDCISVTKCDERLFIIFCLGYTGFTRVYVWMQASPTVQRLLECSIFTAPPLQTIKLTYWKWQFNYFPL